MNIEDLTRSTLDALKSAVNTDTIVGQPINTDGYTILPISKVSFGFVSGGGEYSESAPKVLDTFPYANVSSGGASVLPIGFIVLGERTIRFIDIEKTGEGKWGELLQAGIKLIKK